MLIALVLGLAFNAAQIAVDLTRERQGALGNAAYGLDPVLGEQVVRGLMHYASVYRAEILDDFGDMLAKAEKAPAEHEENWLARQFFDELETFWLPLVAREGEYPVGRLTVWLSPTRLAEDFMERAWLTILSGLVRNLVLAAAMRGCSPRPSPALSPG